MEVYELVQAPRPCSYLPNLEASFRYFYIKNCTVYLLLRIIRARLEKIWKLFFVPTCKTCDACISIRQDCANFVFSKSHKRTLKAPLTLRVSRPRVSDEHLNLYDKYHQKMHEKKGWDYQGITLDAYYDTFVRGFLEFGYEFDYYVEDKLVGVAYVDILPAVISAVYCYYDHDFEHFSIGTYSILKQIEVAKRYNIKYLYPGYWIQNHHSMGYKERFKPFEILCNRPDLNENPLWVKE